MATVLWGNGVASEVADNRKNLGGLQPFKKWQSTVGLTTNTSHASSQPLHAITWCYQVLVDQHSVAVLGTGTNSQWLPH